MTAERRDWLAALATYGRPRVLAMLFLGFSAGLPFLLVFSTLSAWLAQTGISRTEIGLLSWIGITYSIKFFWAPVVDRLPLPLLTRALGRRRGWMLLAQFGIVGGLYGLSLSDPSIALGPIVWLALLVAFSSATQDIVIDAWRIEAVENELQGHMAAAYQFGYRVALIVAGAGTPLKTMEPAPWPKANPFNVTISPAWPKAGVTDSITGPGGWITERETTSVSVTKPSLATNFGT